MGNGKDTLYNNRLANLNGICNIPHDFDMSIDYLLGILAIPITVIP